jgi:hypothetical protein
MNTFRARGFAYEACDIPADMTIGEFRARRESLGAGRTSVLKRLRRLAGRRA